MTHAAAFAALAGAELLVVGLGDLGGAFAGRAALAGARVTGVRRGSVAPRGVTLVRADAADPVALARVPDTARLAVICVTPTDYDEDGYHAAYTGVARAFAERFAGSLQLRRVLFVSSTAVFPQGDGAIVDDRSETAAEGHRARALLAAEEALAAAGIATTAVALSGLYGPGRTALIRRALAGRGAAPDPVHFTNRIHRDDAAGALAFVAARALAGAALPARVLATDPTPAPRHEVLDWLMARLGVDVREIADDGRDRAPSRRMLPRWLLSAGFGFSYRDYRAGFEAVIAEMEANGALAELRDEISAA